MNSYTEALKFFIENKISLTSDQLRKLQESKLGNLQADQYDKTNVGPGKKTNKKVDLKPSLEEIKRLIKNGEDEDKNRANKDDINE